VYSTTYISTLSGNANMALSLIQGTGVDLGIRSNPNKGNTSKGNYCCGKACYDYACNGKA
jgi:hypothetical protein